MKKYELLDNINPNSTYAGIEALTKILKAITDNFSKQDRRNIYPDKQIIYRGITRDYENCERDNNWHIRSGLSVRFRNQNDSNTNLNKAEYIKYLRNIITDARKSHPKKYTDEISDLEVLADIQHNGGATCLVDFSKNILTSLWFACNNDTNVDGFLFCYNVTEDVVYNNSLTILTQEDCKKPIRDLLIKTYRLVDACSIVSDRFCLWDPALINNRIARQDSLFLFGIEQFKASEMSDMTMLMIRIPSKLKQPICKLLKSMFCIKSTSIYNDPVGFAASNSKLNPMDDIIQSDQNRYYSKAFKALLSGYYSEAIELYNGIRINYINKNDCDNLKKSIEIDFSLASCYKKLEKGSIDYKHNAILAYERVIENIKHILKGYITEDEQKYYIRKIMRAYNEIIELCYILKRYKKGIDICNKIEQFITNSTIDCNNNDKQNIPDCRNCEKRECKRNMTLINIKKNLDTKYPIFVKLEFYILHFLSSENNNHNFNIIKECESFLNTHELKQFDRLLVTYYLRFLNILQINSKKESITHFLGNSRNAIDKIVDKTKTELSKLESGCLSSDINIVGYIEWNFADIKIALDNLDKKNNYLKIKLQELNAFMISVRNHIQSKHDLLYRRT